MRKVLLIIVCILLFAVNAVLAQNKLKVDVSYNEKSLQFNFCNSTDDTLYLFSTYFDSTYISAKYLHQIDKSKKEYKISFKPLLPFISPILTDRLILGEDKIMKSGQNVFEFIILKPHSELQIELSKKNLFRKMGIRGNVVKAYTHDDFLKRKIKTATYDSKKRNYKLYFEFAYYLKINLITTREAFFNNYHSAFLQQEDFDTIIIEVDSENLNRFY